MASVSKAKADLSFIDSKSEADTIRLWENYREQALMWRALSLLQIPTTLAAVLLAVWLWNTRAVTLNVPARPLPGIYQAEEIPNEQFIEAATSLVNLIASYQPAIARKQFEYARTMLKEPLLSRFDAEMISLELKAIEGSNRTQIFFVDPTRTLVERKRGEVTVSLIGERTKLIAGREMPSVKTKFSITMGTLPRNDINPYGIVVTNINVENIER